MGITEATAAYHSIIWFACDSMGQIIFADSNEGAIPAFAAANEAQTLLLAQKLCGLNAIEHTRTPPIDYTLLAGMGFYCYANTDPFDGKLYHLCAKPERPIFIDDLEPELRKLLEAKKLPVNAAECDRFSLD